MNLTPPSTAVAVISLILAALAIIGKFVAIPFISEHALLGRHHRLCRAGGRQPVQRRLACAASGRRKLSGGPRDPPNLWTILLSQAWPGTPASRQAQSAQSPRPEPH